MNPMAPLKWASWGLSLFGRTIPLPWVMAASLALVASMQWHLGSEKDEVIDKLKWQVASLERAHELAGARADQATSALQALRKGYDSLRKANEGLGKEVASLRSRAAYEAASGALRACRNSHDLIRESLYK